MIASALHLHSTYSDGEFTLPELRDIFTRVGCRVVCVSDHAESFKDSDKLQRYADECASLSDQDVLLLASLEFACRNKLHILGYGVTARYPSEEPMDIIQHIADHGGVAVIAHPRTDMFEWIAGFDKLPDGIEAWNTKYDGRRAPRPETFRFLLRLRERKPELRAFYGIDLHWRKQFRQLLTLIDLPSGEVTRANVLQALAAGRFVGAVGNLQLPSDALVADELLEHFGVLNRRGRRLKTVLMRAKRWADALGLRAPARLKAQLRRWL